MHLPRPTRATLHRYSLYSRSFLQVPNSGKLFQTSMASIRMAFTRELMTCSWNVSPCTTTRSVPTSTFLVPSWLILNPGQWTPFALVLLVTFSVPTTSSLGRAVLVTTGQKDVSIAHQAWTSTLITSILISYF